MSHLCGAVAGAPKAVHCSLITLVNVWLELKKRHKTNSWVSRGCAVEMVLAFSQPKCLGDNRKQEIEGKKRGFEVISLWAAPFVAMPEHTEDPEGSVPADPSQPWAGRIHTTNPTRAGRQPPSVPAVKGSERR